MEKNKFCEELKKRGYDAAVEGGVVMIKKPGKIEDTIKEIKLLAEKLDYNQSIGVRKMAVSVEIAAKTDNLGEAEQFEDDNDTTKASESKSVNEEINPDYEASKESDSEDAYFDEDDEDEDISIILNSSAPANFDDVSDINSDFEQMNFLDMM